MRTTRASMVAVVVAGALLAGAGDAAARPRPSRSTQRFSANKNFGLGLMLGAPSGLSGKWFFGPDTALDFGLGAIRYYRHRDGLHLHADYLWHPVSLVSAPPFELPLYVGVGGRVLFFDDDNDDRVDNDGVAIGVRGPVGIAFDFNNVPLDVFFEIALVLDFFVDYSDDVDLDVNGAIGLRYWFE